MYAIRSYYVSGGEHDQQFPGPVAEGDPLLPEQVRVGQHRIEDPPQVVGGKGFQREHPAP